MNKPSEIKIGKYTLEEILIRHFHWLNKDCEGWENMRANLCGAILYDADLSHVNLCGAILYDADLRFANLSHITLSHADLRFAKLTHADLSHADLRYAKLSYANIFDSDLRFANLSHANLNNANLHHADLSEADLCAAENIPFIPLACPSDGAFTAWKKVKDYLVKLEIPASAKRCSATSQICRASKAKVLGIYTLDGKKTNLKNVINTTKTPELDYIVGKTVYPDSFDENRWNECSNGIHFFVNKQDAIDYNY